MSTIAQQKQQSMSSSPSPIWFLLLDSDTDQPYKGTSADKVFVSFSPDVSDFRKAVLLENSSILTGITDSQLFVYKNKAAFDKRKAAVDEEKENPLEEDSLINGLGSSKKEALAVVVPSSSRSSSKSSLSVKEPNPKRKQRWIELNEILEGNAKRSKISDSVVAYSYVTWSEVKSVFNPTNYVQPRRNIDNTQLTFLSQYLSMATKCFGDVSTGKEVKRLYFIAPVLICVCILVEGDVEIVVEEDLVGKFVKAHGRFEFMLKRGKKAICIVEAKKDDVEQGMAQDLLGCEVAVELGGLDIVYGIVTNYIQWNFFRSLDDKVEREECSLRLTPKGPEAESLKEITEKIYSMLS